jgi:hypothetical protein
VHLHRSIVPGMRDAERILWISGEDPMVGDRPVRGSARSSVLTGLSAGGFLNETPLETGGGCSM